MGMNPPERRGRPARSANRGRPTPRPVPSVVETIANGLTLVLVYPIVLLLPLLLDSAYWLGIRVSPTALLNRFDSMADAADSIGLTKDVAPLVSLFVPSLLGWVDHDRIYRAWTAPELEPGSWGAVCLAISLLVLAGTFLSVFFRLPLALVVRHQRRSPGGFLRAAWTAWLRTLGLAALLLGIAGLIASPLLVLSWLLLLAGLNILPLLVALLSLPTIAAAIYLHFTPDAILVSDVGPLRAIYLSFNTVRRNFWATLGLVGSLLLISEGLPVLWLSQAKTPFGLLLGVLGNAFFGAGLALATMQFYLDRLRRWLPDPAPPNGGSFAH